ncbi:uncharacterized protein LOC144107205 [Amblyomma americanum]
MAQKTPGAGSTAPASGRMKPHGDPAPKQQPQQQQHPPPAPRTAAPAVHARAASPSESETSESASSSTSTSSSSGASLREYEGAILDTASTSSSSAAIEARQKGRRMRRYSDTVYPAAGRRKRSSSVDAGVETEEERNNKFCLYSVLAVILTVATASVISMSLRAGDSDGDEPHEYILPKQATTREPQCRCNGGPNSTTAEPDSVTSRDGQHRAPAAEAQSTVTGPAAAGGGAPGQPEDGKAVESEGGLTQKLAGKATRAFVAYKIGPGRRKPAAKVSTVTPQETVSSASLKQDDHPGTQTTRTPETQAKPGDATETQPTTEQTRREERRPTAPSSQTITSTEPGDATAWEMGRPLVGVLGAGQRLRAVRKETPDHPKGRRGAPQPAE